MFSVVSAKAILTCILLSMSLGSALCSCVEGWFGDDCEFQCHCAEGETCLENGKCPGKCSSHWFGQKCQYASMPYTAIRSSGSIVAWLTDSDDALCNEGERESVTLHVEKPLLITFLRFTFNKPAFPSTFVINYHHVGNTTLTACTDHSFADIDAVTVDFWCVTEKPVKTIYLGAAALDGLCSVRISLGRNLAVGGKAKQSSQKQDWKANKAIDGVIVLPGSSEDVKRSTCSHTKPQVPGYAWFKLTFPSLVRLNHFVVYGRNDLNRDGCCDERLRGFRLEAFDKEYTKVFNYIDSSPELVAVYSISPPSAIKAAVKMVKIISPTKFLTLCEVFVFGELICDPNKYGLECERQCDCSKEASAPGNRFCFINSGGCPGGCPQGSMGANCDTTCWEGTWGSGCKKICSAHCDKDGTMKCDIYTGKCDKGCEIGYQPPTCQFECLDSTYGDNCSQKCSRECAGTGFHCHHITGHCTRGCSLGFQPPLCVSECPPGTFGATCLKCSEHCANTSADENTCDRFSGKCARGCQPGYQHDNCFEECSVGKYGQDCLQPCSKTCLNTDCHHLTGQCKHCVPGYRGSFCEHECSARRWGSNCTQVCSHHCKDSLCNRETGDCLACPAGRMLPHCSRVLTALESKGGFTGLGLSLELLLATAVLASLLVTCLVAVQYAYPSGEEVKKGPDSQQHAPGSQQHDPEGEHGGYEYEADPGYDSQRDRPELFSTLRYMSQDPEGHSTSQSFQDRDQHYDMRTE